MASSAQLMRSPALSSMSISRSGGSASDLARQRQELVRGVAARAHDGAHAVALLERGHDAPRDVRDARGVGDG